VTISKPLKNASKGLSKDLDNYRDMRISYSPKECKGRQSVEHLITKDSIFIAPTTFPKAKTCGDYAEIHKSNKNDL
jgi:hypothetical protein